MALNFFSNSGPKKPISKVQINRDPNNVNCEFNGLGRNVRPGVAARVNRVTSAIHAGRLGAAKQMPNGPTPSIGTKTGGNNFKLNF